MALNWNKHRFSGGALVFDLVNTVVRRNDPVLRLDRLTDPVAIIHFANAALDFRKEEVRHYSGDHIIEAAEIALLISLREAAYEYFMPGEGSEIARYPSLSRLLSLVGNVLNHSAAMPFVTDVALSALQQIIPRQRSRLKMCPNCDWLFLDRSKNSSRIWCDMSVCGNRQKARRNYLKRSNDALAQETR
jgi:predicted RNA-binding Zn ribbon-like protein